MGLGSDALGSFTTNISFDLINHCVLETIYEPHCESSGKGFLNKCGLINHPNVWIAAWDEQYKTI